MSTPHLITGEMEAATDYYQGNLLEALQQYKSMLASFPEDSDLSTIELMSKGTLLSNIGGIYATLGQYQRALEYLQPALSNQWS